jgi:hypothetical protein
VVRLARGPGCARGYPQHDRSGWRTPVRRPDRLGQCLRAGSGLMKGVASASFIAAGRAER